MRPPDLVSLWDATAPEAPASEPLQHDRAVEVAIVGGGFTGCSAALHLAERGVHCMVLEAHKFGYGGSGRAVGLVNAGLWLPPDTITQRLGREQANLLVAALGAGPELVYSLIEKFQIECEAVRTGTIQAAHARAGVRDIEECARQWVRRGAPVEVLDAAATSAKLGCDRYHGGLLDHRAGTVNPMGYARGLARAAGNAGAVLHEGSRVLKIEPAGGSWRLHTREASVTASRVIIATNAYTDPAWPGLQQVFTPIHYFQIASAPLGAEAAAVLPERQGVWDTAPIMLSIRRDAQGRLMLGGMGKLVGHDASITRRWADKTVRRLFPQLGAVEWQDWWDGCFAFTREHIPRLLELAPGVYSPIGYNGRGIAPGTVFGKALADWLFGGSSEMPLPRTAGVTPERFRTMKAALYETAFKTYRFARSL